MGWLALGATPFLARWIHVSYRANDPASTPWWPYVGFAFGVLLVAEMLGAPPRTSSRSDVFVNATVTSLSVLGAAATSQVLFPATLPRFVILTTTGLIAVWLLLFGGQTVSIMRRSGAALRVVAVINADDGAQLQRDVDAGPWEKHFSLIGIISDEAEFESIEARCHDERATTLVVGRRSSLNPVVLDQASRLHSQGLQIRSIDEFYDEFLGKLPLSSVSQFSLMTDVDSIHGGYAPLKRTIDVACALVGMVVLAVVIPFVLIGNLISNRGPLWFTQERLGRNKQPFKIWKFRTMQPGAIDVSGWTSEEDPRITRFGRILRVTHIDELPQMYNILIGDLSIVGPRPEQIAYAEALDEKLPFYAARLLVRPGLTGWAQVRYRYAASVEDAYVKLQYDLHYIRHEALTTDLRIIALTVSHLLRGSGR